jgi:putative ABC transport system permease protein
VANAVRGFVERKRASIATLKSLGAPGSQVVAIYLVQVMLIALVGHRDRAPGRRRAAFRDHRRLRPSPADPDRPDARAGANSGSRSSTACLTALAFAIAPLGRAHDVQVSGLFRDQIDPERRYPRPRYLVILAVCVGALVAASVLAAYDRRIALIFIAAAAMAFGLLRLVASGLMALAARLPRPRATAPRLALANLHRPGALTPSLVLSLGLGITLLVTLAVIDSNLTRQLTQTLPDRAPSFFFLDIPNQDAERFEAHLRTLAPSARVDRVPMMRGRLVSLKGVPVGQIKAAEQFSWVLVGDRGITYAALPPQGSEITAGQWWEPDHRGKPLLSFDAKIAEGLGLTVGDEVVVNVLGRNISATIANLRNVEWRTLGSTSSWCSRPTPLRARRIPIWPR